MAVNTNVSREPGQDGLDSFSPAVMERILRENWWAIALRGVLGIIFGLIALFVPVATILSLVWVFAAYMLIDGAFSIAGAIRMARRAQRWGWVLFEGIISIIAGVLAFLLPGTAALVFVLIIAAWSIILGAMQLVAGFKMLRGERGKGWLVFSGIVSVLFGALLIISPLIGALVLTWWLGAYVLVTSILLLVVAFAVRSKAAGPNAPREPTKAARA